MVDLHPNLNPQRLRLRAGNKAQVFLNFSRQIRPEKNSEIFRVLQSHNLFSARCLQKNSEASIYKAAEMGKAEMSLKNLTTDGFHGCPERLWKTGETANPRETREPQNGCGLAESGAEFSRRVVAEFGNP
jgi:hypothetical protein